MSANTPSVMKSWLPHPPSSPSPLPDRLGRGGTDGGAAVQPRSAKQEAYIHAMETHALIMAQGPAGTGKTYLAAALAARALRSGVVEKIIMSRPALEAGERLGFLPGDLREKIDPYLRPLYDALGQVIGAEETQRIIRAGLIEIAPLAFMRGRSLSNAFVILDEAQNCTPEQMKMFLTRIGQESIFVICGDGAQSDLPKGAPSGFHQALKILASVPSVAIIHFGTQDIQRSTLVADIVAAYEKGEKNES